ncbi:nicotinamide-nucleotide amidase [Endozoicomonas sp. SM1973]|uniref:Nicotinamide-nucleotide amidase n=1 Tax=Spartinivicinus marinus TaxID=2994442 RepID=A0A853HUA6_9GAMM|nr:nicotinamide-nucleotide amidase [Spartinivicinus marinus]MCX4025421.1 nicotinamide-nucleotide amidase [Spartinivicinus marinus]NYZ65350.1 nicotinamide-nucleotide amidase [Spartinivicinus marinus]
MSDAIKALAEQVGAFLINQQLKLITAESCTGGWVAQAVTAIAGSSSWFEGAFVTYSNEAKRSMLEVSQQSLIQFGAVSKAVVMEMVDGALAHSEADIAVAISGIAGPDGGSAEKPVGTVWVAWQLHEQPAISRCYHFSGDREQVREQAVVEALKGILEHFNN